MATVKSVNGVAAASVKSLDGVVVASIKSIDGVDWPVSVTYATWNPSDKSANITLSNGNLTATNAGVAAWVGVRSTVTKSTGKWYWELTVVQNTTAVGVVGGVCTLTRALNANTTPDLIAYLMGQGGFRENNGAEDGGYGNASNGDVVGVAWDADAGTVQIFLNNSSLFTTTNALTGTNAAIFQAFVLSDAITANFGATAFAFSPPGGFNSGLYS